MVETRERDVVYTTQDSGPTAALVFLLALLIVSLVGFMVYYFAHDKIGLENPTQIIEHNTNTTTPVPVPVPVPTPTAPSAPVVPNDNSTMPSPSPAPSDTGTPAQ